jgi:DUF971 family protein
MNVHPTRLELARDGLLHIAWSDGQRRVYTVRELRNGCTCATCREKRDHPQPPPLLPVLKAEEARPLAILGMEPMGHYAYSIRFSDGHDTGIYTLEHLRQLGREDE